MMRCGALAALAVAAFAGPAFAQKTQLTVYTALETDQLKAVQEGLRAADNPTIEIKWVRDSTGVITAKLLAEKANPQADIVLGLAASSMALFANEGMLEPYAPVGVDELKPGSATRQDARTWVGMDAYLARRLLQHRRGARRQEHAEARDAGRT